jgi:hypothetical protein
LRLWKTVANFGGCAMFSDAANPWSIATSWQRARLVIDFVDLRLWNKFTSFGCAMFSDVTDHILIVRFWFWR